MFFGLFLLFSYSFICFSCRSSKMTSFPLHFLLLFILFPSVLSLFLSLLVFSFLSPFSPFQTSFCWSLYYLCVSSCQTLCKKKSIFLNFCKTLFFCLLFSIKISVFSDSFFVGLFSDFCIFPCFVFLSLEKWFLILFDSHFWILLVNSVSFFYCPFFI